MSDFPASIFSDELVAAFPEAKVILTVRDEDKWFDSMMATIWHAWSAPDAPKETPMRLLADKYHRYMWQNDFPYMGARGTGRTMLISGRLPRRIGC